MAGLGASVRAALGTIRPGELAGAVYPCVSTRRPADTGGMAAAGLAGAGSSCRGVRPTLGCLLALLGPVPWALAAPGIVASLPAASAAHLTGATVLDAARTAALALAVGPVARLDLGYRHCCRLADAGGARTAFTAGGTGPAQWPCLCSV